MGHFESTSKGRAFGLDNQERVMSLDHEFPGNCSPKRSATWHSRRNDAPEPGTGSEDRGETGSLYPAVPCMQARGNYSSTSGVSVFQILSKAGNGFRCRARCGSQLLELRKYAISQCTSPWPSRRVRCSAAGSTHNKCLILQSRRPLRSQLDKCSVSTRAVPQFVPGMSRGLLRCGR